MGAWALNARVQLWQQKRPLPLADAGKSLELVFRHWRDRYNVACYPDKRRRGPGISCI